jgi:Trp operon repressor
MEHLSLDMEHNQESRVYWRRDKIQELSSKGHSQREIATLLRIGVATVNRDLFCLRQQAKNNIKRYVDERLPEEYEKCLVGITSILREAWIASQDSEDKREKIQALSLAKECYAMKLDLLTNATVVEDAIRFVSSRAVAAATETDNADDTVTLDKESTSSDIQGSEENRSRQSTTATARTTNNTIF